MSGNVKETSRIPGKRGLSETFPVTSSSLPSFKIEISRPDLSRWEKGNSGIRGFHHFRAAKPGPHVALTALMHGNELAGAVVLSELLSMGIRPERGALSIIFLNLDAFYQFCPGNPVASRFIHEDMNRLWHPSIMSSSKHSLELERVREIFPIFQTVDHLMDLHSMLWPAPPLILSGSTERGLRLGRNIGIPSLIVADHGHQYGKRLIDIPHFTSPDSKASACLLEAGQHWTKDSVETTRLSVSRFLMTSGICDTPPYALPDYPSPDPVIAQVTECITARSRSLTFTESFTSGDIIRCRGTLLAWDGEDEIRTPYDNCMLIMPNPRTARGHTAVRLARITPAHIPDTAAQ